TLIQPQPTSTLFPYTTLFRSNEQDSTKTGYSLGNIKMPNPNSVLSKYTYDPVSNRYIYTETIGEFNITYPIILTPEEYDRLILRSEEHTSELQSRENLVCRLL